MGMHVVLVGNPLEGVQVYGPFATGLEAAEWARSEFSGEDWWTAMLYAP